ncbi:conserved hypothetical protein [Hyphomicrobiales bacterium]|nr:conserved hypothetical protein [Hyphomicrobiales bacterium]
MSLNYTSYISQVSELLALDSPANPEFALIIPGMIDYAEQRIYRELDLLQTVVRNSTNSTTLNSRNAAIPNTFVTVQSINVITPAGTLPDNGTRVPLQPVSRDFVDYAWPNISSAGVPNCFAMVDQWNIIVGPAANGAYRMEVIGTIRPAPLSVSNTTTFLTEHLPDLFVAASMVYGSGWQKNFGSQADDPGQSVSWENQYKTLIASAGLEEVRKKFEAQAWASRSPSPIASPNR